MRQSPHFSFCATILWMVLFVACPIQATIFHPQAFEAKNGAPPQRRALCEKATLDVQEDRIIDDACDQNPQNDYSLCYQQLDQYMKQSTTETCATYYNTYLTCVNGHGQNETVCNGPQLDYALCSNHTLQAYAYCGCYYNLPDILYECANVQLEIRPDTPQASGAPATSDLPKVPIPDDSSQSLFSFLPYSPISGAAAATPVVTTPAITSTGTADNSSASAPLTLPGTGQITTTSVSTVVITRTTTIATCPPAVISCPAGLPATSTYTEAETRTILSCDGGCTGPAPAGAENICVARRRRRAVVLG